MRAVHYEYVHLDTMQIGGMVATSEEWRSELEAMLNMFAHQPDDAQSGFFAKIFSKPKPETGWDIFKRRFDYAYAGSKGEEPWPYCGDSGTDKLMSWENEP